MNSTEAEERVIQLCKKFEDGITYKTIQDEVPNLTLSEIVQLINRLLSKNKVDLLKKNDGSLLIKLKETPSDLCKLKDGDPEEQIIYKIIEESSVNGIWAKDIRIKSNLHLNTVDKVLRKLDGKKLIKSFNAVLTPKKKRYIVYDLEPARELIGGAWYSDQQFDSEFVDVLNQQCFKFLEQKALQAKQVVGGPIAVESASYVTSKDVLECITKWGVTKVELQLEEIEAILDTLVYDGKVQKSASADGSKLYKAANSFLDETFLMAVPCGTCPMISLCDDIGNVTSSNCRYFEDWLKL